MKINIKNIVYNNLNEAETYELILNYKNGKKVSIIVELGVWSDQSSLNYCYNTLINGKRRKSISRKKWKTTTGEKLFGFYAGKKGGLIFHHDGPIMVEDQKHIFKDGELVSQFFIWDGVTYEIHYKDHLRDDSRKLIGYSVEIKKMSKN